MKVCPYGSHLKINNQVNKAIAIMEIPLIAIFPTNNHSSSNNKVSNYKVRSIEKVWKISMAIIPLYSRLLITIIIIFNNVNCNNNVMILIPIIIIIIKIFNNLICRLNLVFSLNFCSILISN